MSLALQKLGSRVSFYATDYSIDVYVSSLTKNLQPTLELVTESLLQPAFNEDDFKRLQSQIIQGIESSKKQPSRLAWQGWMKLLYGDTIAGIEDMGTVSTISALTVKDVAEFYNQFVKPEAAELIVVSDLTQQKLMPALSLFDNWQGKSAATEVSFDKTAFDPNTVYMVNKDEAAQSVIRIGKRGMPRDFTGEFFKATLMNFTLGEAFNSRIMLNLREDKGYTYGARSYFWGDRFDGGFTALADVRADVTDKAFLEFKKEITAYYEKGMTQEELEFMRKAIGQRDALKYETPRDKLNFMANILKYNLDRSFVEQQAKIINSVQLKELNELAKKHLDFNTMAKLVVGDLENLKPAFEAMGYKVEELKLPE
jgi:zinc protease